jgi:hypothetical protein
MVKVSIKKNVKPKTLKQKQKQTQNVTVNIGSINKKRTRTKKKLQIEKKPIQQPVIAPSIISYNQPTFKQSPQQPIQPQPSSLTSSILATQSAPNIVSNENKIESALTRALVEQNTNTDTNPEELINDLERTRKKRIEKLDQPNPSLKKINKEEAIDPIRTGLLGQILDEKEDDTEEINALIASSTVGGLFRPTSTVPNPLRVIYDYTPTLSNPLSGVKVPTIPNPLSRIGITSSSLTNYLDSFLDEEQPPPSINLLDNQYYGGVEEAKNSEPPEEETPPTILQPAQPPPTILQPVQPEPTILEQVPQEPNDNYEEFSAFIDNIPEPPIQEEPPKQEEAPLLNPLNLQPIQPSPPTILEQSGTKKSLTESLKGAAEEPQAVETLQAEATPILQVENVIPGELYGFDEALALFKKLKSEGKIDKSVKQDKPSDTAQSGKVKKSEKDLTNDINKVEGYENWKAKSKKRGRPSNELSTLTEIVAQPSLLQLAGKQEVKQEGYKLPEGASSILDLYES